MLVCAASGAAAYGRLGGGALTRIDNLPCGLTFVGMNNAIRLNRRLFRAGQLHAGA